MVTKKEQLEWLARLESWPSHNNVICMDHYAVGIYGGSIPIAKEEWQQERDKMQKQGEKADSWHERGELPPIGTICEIIDDKKTWCECEIIAHKNGFCIGWISSRNAPFYTDDKNDFRPLRTEREKAIDEMISAIDHIKKGNFQTFIGALYDAGYRKEQSK